MSLLDKATIIATPTAHSEGKLHSIKGGSVADFDVVRGSAATRVNAEGLIEDVATNIPRIDYSTGEGVLLLEPQSTNLITYSEDFSQWSVSGTPVVTSNYGVSPDGAQNSTRLQLDNNDRIFNVLSTSGDVTFSVYLKGSGVITLRDNTNVHRQDVTLTSNWVRYNLSFNATVTNVQIQNQDTGAVDCEIYGAQVEELPYASSYIPTNGAIATRLADSVTGAGDTSTFNSTEGTLYFEGSTLVNGGVNRYISISDNTSSNRRQLVFSSVTNRLQISGTNTTAINYSSFVQTNNNKVAYSYSASGVRLFVNGVLVGSNTDNASLPTNSLTTLDLALWNQTSAPFQGKVKSLITFNTALTDAELECLTTI